MASTYLDTCCNVLEERMDQPQDAILVKFVKIQQIAQSISLTQAMHRSGQKLPVPLGQAIKTSQQQLSDFKNGLSSYIREMRESLTVASPNQTVS